MHYLGGKGKTRKQISSFLESVRKKDQVYFEPFVGAGWVLQEMSGKRIASDGNKALITLYKAIQSGWIPPDNVSEEEYRYYKKIQDCSDPMTAFVGICCSFAGRWFQGYARSGSRNFALNGKNSLLKQAPLVSDAIFKSGLYTDFTPKDALIYCDPPYQGRKPYEACPKFDVSLFWDNMRAWSKNNCVVISEYTAPDDFDCVLEIPTATSLRSVAGKGISTVEKLFMLRR